MSGNVTLVVLRARGYPRVYIMKMKALGLALLLALSVAAAPEPADADGRRGDGRRHSFRGFRGRDHHHQHHHRRALPHRPFFHGFSSPSVIVTSPLVVTPAPVYAPPPLYAPPVYYAPPAYAPPIPRVVEFPTGRYELRGDGVTSPYVWVWVPNPPAAPPLPPAPAAPPGEVPDAGAARRAPGRPAVTYRWTDENGVTTWTDSLEKVPARFRAEAGQSALTR